MWLDCEIQLAGSPQHRRHHGVNILVQTESGPVIFSVDLSAVRYAIEDFCAQPAWGVAGPAECPQTGPGYVRCEPQGLTRHGYEVVLATRRASQVLLPLKVRPGQLWEDRDIRQRLSA